MPTAAFPVSYYLRIDGRTSFVRVFAMEGTDLAITASHLWEAAAIIAECSEYTSTISAVRV